MQVDAEENWITVPTVENRSSDATTWAERVDEIRRPTWIPLRLQSTHLTFLLRSMSLKAFCRLKG